MNKLSSKVFESCLAAYDSGFETSTKGGVREDCPHEVGSHESTCWRTGFEDHQTLKQRGLA